MYSRDPPCQILYCYGIYQPLERTIKNFRSKQGLLSSEELDEFTMYRRHKLIVIDDLMHREVEDKEMELLFTQGTHHKCVSVILITQNLYPRGKHARTIALNTWYLVLMKNLRDVSQVGILGRQLYPGRVKGFMKAYEDSLGSKQGYLIVNTSPRGDDQYGLSRYEKIADFIFLLKFPLYSLLHFLEFSSSVFDKRVCILFHKRCYRHAVAEI